MTTAFIIRFHYEKEDPRFEWRFEYFKKDVLPRILAQTDQNFTIAIRCNEWSKPLFEALSDRIVTFTVKNERVLYKKSRNKKYFYDFAKWEEVEGLPQYDLQLGLDSDDLISPPYLETVRDYVNFYAESTPGKSVHICFQPLLLNVETGQESLIGQTYTPTMGSAFFALYQPDKKHYLFAYEVSHLKIGTLMDTSMVLPSGYCWASVHKHNESTGKTS